MMAREMGYDYLLLLWEPGLAPNEDKGVRHEVKEVLQLNVLETFQPLSLQQIVQPTQ